MVAPPALFDLSGKVAVVTGSTKGLGRAMAQGLAAAGAAVVVHRIADHRQFGLEQEHGAARLRMPLLHLGPFRRDERIHPGSSGST